MSEGENAGSRPDLSRRGFLRGLGVAAAVVAGGSLLEACSSGSRAEFGAVPPERVGALVSNISYRALEIYLNNTGIIKNLTTSPTESFIAIGESNREGNLKDGSIVVGLPNDILTQLEALRGENSETQKEQISALANSTNYLSIVSQYIQQEGIESYELTKVLTSNGTEPEWRSLFQNLSNSKQPEILSTTSSKDPQTHVPLNTQRLTGINNQATQLLNAFSGIR